MDDSLTMAIFMELFCSIHMSVFVLKPLAEMINRSKKTIIFCILFCIRIVILVIGDFIAPMAMATIDFLSVFLGAFIILPVSIGLRSELGAKKANFNDFDEVKDYELSNIGITHPEMLNDILINKYNEFLIARSNFDYNKLNQLCTNNYYDIVTQSLKNLTQKKYKNIIKDIEIKKTKITSVNAFGTQFTVDFLVEAEYFDYVVNQDNIIQYGKNDNKKVFLHHITFSKNVSDNNSNITCSQCGAPINLSQGNVCKFCSCVYDVEGTDWLIAGLKNFM